MNQRAVMSLILGVCAVLLVIGFIFSSRITDGIQAAAHREAVDQSPVPTPPALLPTRAASAKTPAHG